MSRILKVTYIRHSGFLAELDDRYLLFDYWRGELPPLDYKKPLYIFSSHAHRDHYVKDIFKMERLCETVKYILSFDIKAQSGFWKTAEHVEFMDAGAERQMDGMRIRTLRSTDEGVAFLIKTEGSVIYHAGDLHWWHWPGDPDSENDRRKTDYQREIGKLAGEDIDCSFVVLDPRQAGAGGWGMDYFLKNVKSRYVFPMHFWEKYSFAEEYINKNKAKYPSAKIMAITQAGQSFELGG